MVDGCPVRVGAKTQQEVHMTTNAYMNLIEAVQAYVTSEDGDQKFARDWILVAGVEDLHRDTYSSTEVRVVGSPHAASYTMTGLLSWGMEMFDGNYTDE
jgi:hypothetical protein